MANLADLVPWIPLVSAVISAAGALGTALYATAYLVPKIADRYRDKDRVLERQKQETDLFKMMYTERMGAAKQATNKAAILLFKVTDAFFEGNEAAKTEVFDLLKDFRITIDTNGWLYGHEAYNAADNFLCAAEFVAHNSEKYNYNQAYRYLDVNRYKLIVAINKRMHRTHLGKMSGAVDGDDELVPTSAPQSREIHRPLIGDEVDNGKDYGTFDYGFFYSRGSVKPHDVEKEKSSPVPLTVVPMSTEGMVSLLSSV